MDSEKREKLRKWLSGELKVGKSPRPGLPQLFSGDVRFLDAHIDELFPHVDEGADQLQVAYAAFVQLAELLHGLADRFMVTLVISLQESDDPTAKPPRHEELEKDLSSTPPSLYVVPRVWFQQLNVQEVHRTPLHWQPVHSKTPEAYVTYRVSRAFRAVMDGWEYQRSIEIEHYPPSLIPTESWPEWLSFVYDSEEDVSRTTDRWKTALQKAANQIRWSFVATSIPGIRVVDEGGARDIVLYDPPYSRSYFETKHTSRRSKKKLPESKRAKDKT